MDSCDIYKNPSKSTFFTSVILAVGIVASYLPQYDKIIKTKTSIGLAPIFLFLISIAGVSATSNLVLLSFLSLPCCAEITPFECVNSQVSLIQVGLQAFSTLLITWFCVIFTNTESNKFEYQYILKTWRHIQFCTGIMTLSLIAAFFLFPESSILLYAQFLGILSTIVTIIQYIPQLWTTYRLKASGALSIMMMCIQTPGGFVWTATLMLKPGANWSSWLPYLTAATLQGMLLILSVYYDYLYKGEKPLISTNLMSSYGSIADPTP